MKNDLQPPFRRLGNLVNGILSFARTARRPEKSLHLQWYDRVIYGLGAMIFLALLLYMAFGFATGRLQAP